MPETELLRELSSERRRVLHVETWLLPIVPILFHPTNPTVYRTPPLLGEGQSTDTDAIAIMASSSRAEQLLRPYASNRH